MVSTAARTPVSTSGGSSIAFAKDGSIVDVQLPPQAGALLQKLTAKFCSQTQKVGFCVHRGGQNGCRPALASGRRVQQTRLVF